MFQKVRNLLLQFYPNFSLSKTKKKKKKILSVLQKQIWPHYGHSTFTVVGFDSAFFRCDLNVVHALGTVLACVCYTHSLHALHVLRCASQVVEVLHQDLLLVFDLWGLLVVQLSQRIQAI